MSSTRSFGLSTICILLLSTFGCGGGGGGGDGSNVPGDQGPLTSYKGVDVADMDANGLNDIVAAGYTGDGNGQGRWYVAVFLQRAASPRTFASPVTFDYASNGAVPREIELADLQGDGLPDVVASGWSEEGFRVMLNDPVNPGALKPSVHYGPTGDPDYEPRLEVSDIDGDSYVDVVIADSTTAVTYIQRPDNPGTFQDGMVIGDGHEATDAADINGDGVADVVTFDATGQYRVPDTLLYHRQGVSVPGDFSPPAAIGFEGSGQDIGIADLDDDGRKDVAVSGFDTSSSFQTRGILKTFYQSGTGDLEPFQSLRTSSNLFSNRLTLADLDADGRIEILVGNRTDAGSPNSVEIFAQDAQGNYRSTALLAIPNDRALVVSEMFSVRVNDLNNDSQLDIAVSTNEIFIFFSQPGRPGTFGTATRIAPPG